MVTNRRQQIEKQEQEEEEKEKNRNMDAKWNYICILFSQGAFCYF